MDLKKLFTEDFDEIKVIQKKYERVSFYINIIFSIPFLVIWLGVILLPFSEPKEFGYLIKDNTAFFYLLIFTPFSAFVIFKFYSMLMIPFSSFRQGIIKRIYFKNNINPLYFSIKKKTASYLFPNDFEVIKESLCDDVIQNRVKSNLIKTKELKNRFACIGSYETNNFLYSQFDIKIEHKTKLHSGKTKTFFENRFGHFLLFESPYYIDGSLLIGNIKKWKGFITPLKKIGLEKIPLQSDEVFKKNFSAYTNHTFISDKVLIPEFIEQLKKIKSEFKKQFFLLFEGDYCIFFLSSKHSFLDKYAGIDVGIKLKKINIDSIENEMNSIKEMRDAMLKLDINAAFKRVAE